MDTNSSSLILVRDLIKKYSSCITVRDNIDHHAIGKGCISGVKEIYFSENNVKIGSLFLENDGLWYFWPEETNGYIPDYVMLAIGSMMLELNNTHII